MARITKTIFLTAAEAAVYKSTGTCQHVTPDGDTITVSDTDTDCIVYCPEDEPATKAELAEAVKHHYSTTEQVVGTFIDGKPIYEITYEINSGTIPRGDWYTLQNLDISTLNIDTLVGDTCRGLYEGKMCVYSNIAIVSSRLTTDKSGYEMFFSYSGTVTSLTLQYTKTTDTAPSA